MTEPVRRPTIVTVAAALLFTVAAMAVVVALLPLPYLSKVHDAAKQAYSGLPNGDQIVSITQFAMIGGLVVTIVVGIGFAVLGALDLRGSKVARIITWVVAGLGALCCGGGSVAGNLTSGASRGNVNGVDMTKAAEQVKAAYPSWYQPTVTTLDVLIMVALVVVIILLALPAAGPYFRRPVALPRDPDLPYPPVVR